MGRFIGNWLADTIRFALALGLALAAMQLPALAQSYTTALLQVSTATERDVARRLEIAREFLRLPPGTPENEVEASLRRSEPANASGLDHSRLTVAILRESHESLSAASPLLHPLLALWDGLHDSRADKRAILRTAAEQHVPALLLGTGPLTYGLAGLMLGLLLAQIIISLFQRRRPRYA